MNDSTNKTVVVTGGAGFIGSMVAKVLTKNGYRVVSVDDLSSGYPYLVKYGELEQIRLQDTAKLTKLLQSLNPVGVLHFAASSLVPESVSNPAKYYINNVCGTLSLLQAMLDSNCHKNLVFSSTAAVFGAVESDRLIKETEPRKPINPYGASKSMVERLLADYDSAYGLKYMAMRYFNVIGADPDLEIGMSSYPGSHLLALIFDRYTKKEPVLIYGDDYNTPDGSCIRDYIHVYDIATAHVLALESLIRYGVSKSLNLGNGNGFSVKEVIETVKKVVGEDFPIKVAPRRPGDPARLVADPTTAKEYLGWQLKYPDLVSGVTHAWQWFQKNPERLKNN